MIYPTPYDKPLNLAFTAPNNNDPRGEESEEKNTNQGNASSNFYLNFNVPDSDSIGTWRSKLQVATKDNYLNSWAGQSKATRTTSLLSSESCISQPEVFMESSRKEIKDIKSIFSELMTKITERISKKYSTQDQKKRRLSGCQHYHIYITPSTNQC